MTSKKHEKWGRTATFFSWATHHNTRTAIIIERRVSINRHAETTPVSEPRCNQHLRVIRDTIIRPLSILSFGGHQQSRHHATILHDGPLHEYPDPGSIIQDDRTTHTSSHQNPASTSKKLRSVKIRADSRIISRSFCTTYKQQKSYPRSISNFKPMPVHEGVWEYTSSLFMLTRTCFFNIGNTVLSRRLISTKAHFISQTTIAKHYSLNCHCCHNTKLQ